MNNTLTDHGAPKRHALLKVDLTLVPKWSQSKDSVTDQLGTGFLIGVVGGRGNGKTQLAVEVMRKALEKGSRPLFTTSTQFFLEVRQAYGPTAAESELEVISEYLKPGLLVIDEVGKRGESDWENRLLFHVINRRYNSMKDTLLISNQTPDQFVEAMGESIISRMTETGGIIVADWSAFRKGTP